MKTIETLHVVSAYDVTSNLNKYQYFTPALFCFVLTFKILLIHLELIPLSGISKEISVFVFQNVLIPFSLSPGDIKGNRTAPLFKLKEVEKDMLLSVCLLVY